MDDGVPTITDHEFLLGGSLSNVLADYNRHAETSAMGGAGLEWDKAAYPLYHAVVYCTGECDWTVIAAFRLTGPEPPNLVLGPDTKIRGPMVFTCTRDRFDAAEPVYYTLHLGMFTRLYSAANAAANAIAKHLETEKAEATTEATMEA